MIERYGGKRSRKASPNAEKGNALAETAEKRITIEGSGIGGIGKAGGGARASPTSYIGKPGVVCDAEFGREPESAYGWLEGAPLAGSGLALRERLGVYTNSSSVMGICPCPWPWPARTRGSSTQRVQSLGSTNRRAPSRDSASHRQYGAVPYTFVSGFPCPRDELCPEDARECDCAAATTTIYDQHRIPAPSKTLVHHQRTECRSSAPSEYGRRRETPPRTSYSES
ncbi:hypothetical protein DFH09DRAFT_1277285 [Mycena vulgaris]|nr:hypothetical protein DFH09DRAFT_1277285 [Mycena vulgaris]